MKGGVIIMHNKYVSNLVFLEQLIFNYDGCSAGDGCNCDGDVDECIGNGAD